MENKTERLVRLYNRLRKGPVTIEIMQTWIKQAGIQISTRQLYRDLNYLQHLNIAQGENVVEFTDEKNRKTWKLEYSQESEKITKYDVNSFFLYKNFVPVCILDERKEAFEKFEYFVYQQLSQNKYQETIEANQLYLRNAKFNSYMYSKDEHQKIEDMIWSLQNKKEITIHEIGINTSNIKGELKYLSLVFCPMELIFHENRICIAGVAKDNFKLFIYSIEKSFNYSLTNEHFDRKKYQEVYIQQLSKRFGITEPIDDKIYNIKIEYTDAYGESMKNFFYHESQVWSRLENGNYLLQMKCCINRQLIGLLSYALDKVKVIEPLILRNLLLKKLKQTIDLYEQNIDLNESIANADY